MNLSVDEIANLVNGAVIGDGTVRITGLNGINHADEGDITFFGDQRYARYLESTRASAILVPPSVTSAHRPLIQVQNPHLSFALLLKTVENQIRHHPRGIHPSAVIGENVQLGENVAIGACVIIADDVQIGGNTILYPGVYIGHAAQIGPDTIIYPNTTIREQVKIGARCIIHANVAIGSDGFGFAPQNGALAKIPQVGSVIIGDDVEIGSNSAIDRATCGQTIIGNGTKIDNLVQIGHNVRIGEHCTISGSTGIAGSATIGNRVTVGGQVGINGHIEIGDNVIVGGRSGVTKSVPPNAVVSGFPARDHNETRRIFTSLVRLPHDRRRIRELEERLKKLEKQLNG